MSQEGSGNFIVDLSLTSLNILNTAENIERDGSLLAVCDRERGYASRQPASRASDVNRESGTESANRLWLQPTTAIAGFVPVGTGLQRILPLSPGFLPTGPGCRRNFRSRCCIHFASGFLDWLRG
jgi:hypothetical protein